MDVMGMLKGYAGGGKPRPGARPRMAVLLFLCLLGGLQAGGTLEADTRRHRLSVSGRGGMATMLYRPESGGYRAGGGGSVGLGYEFYFLPYMGIGSGLEFSFLRSSCHTEAREYTLEALDGDPMFGSAGEPFTFRVAMGSEHTVQRAAYVYVPLMLCFRVSWFSFGIGAKAGFPIEGRYDRYMGTLHTSGIYERFPEAFEDMPEHGFVNERAAYGGGRLALRTDWALSVDFGITWRSGGGGKGKGGRVPFLDVGAFADYGLRDLYRVKAGEGSSYPITYDTEVEGCLRHHDGLTGTSGKHAALRSLSVGIRLAIGLSWR